MARILVIEDDGDLQHLISLALNQEKHEVHYAFNGQEGHDKCIRLQPDIVLLDLMLPVIGGMELIRMFASNTLVRDIPIIVMTAHGDKADQLEHSLDAGGVRAYLRKPFDFSEMKSLVRRLVVQYPREPVSKTEIAKGVVRLDTRYRTVWVDGKLTATLPPTVAKLLQALIEAKGGLSRERLMQAVWSEVGKDDALDKTVQRLREALGAHAKRVLTTESGYELVGD